MSQIESGSRREIAINIRIVFYTLILAGQFSQPAKAVDATIDRDMLTQHIAILASDSLEGRRVGEAGEEKAAAYIKNQFESYGLEPLGDSGTFFQSFVFTKKIDFGEKNRLKINGVELELGSGYRPLFRSGNIGFSFDSVISVGYGITVEHSSYDDYYGKEVSGKAVLITRYSPANEDSSESTPDSTEIEWSRYSSITDKIINALDHDVAGIFLVTPMNQDDTLVSRGATRVTPKGIPIIFLRRASFEAIGLDLRSPASFSAMGETDLVRIIDTGKNVIGYLPSDNDTTIIIGAHYDHLGWGAPGSLYREREPKIHYGADDNGSGTAGLLELARTYAANKDEMKYSLLFIAFSGEEAGLLGSNYNSKHMTIDSSKVRMMINMDMIGRLSEQDKGLAIFGTGTCIEFGQFFDSLEIDNLKLTLKESGTGPSDHTAFYNRDIPVLHFFTGAHEDYHKPSDIAERVDIDGIASVIGLVAQVVSHFDKLESPLEFLRTKDENSGRRMTDFSVTLGVMPDYIAEVAGLKIDGITPDKPAERAGIKKGDTIIKMGKYLIDDIYAYMNALGKFRKGDTTTVVIERGQDTLQVLVDFN